MKILFFLSLKKFKKEDLLIIGINPFAIVRVLMGDETKGMYIVNLVTEKKRIVKKFVKD